MNQLVRPSEAGSFAEPIDALLADVAIRVQLSATMHGKAESRYRTISDYLDRDGSVLQGLINLLYPQGSMAIDATFVIACAPTSSTSTSSPSSNARHRMYRRKLALDLLYRSIRGEPGSRYYNMTKRRTRCVTVNYAEHMHLDLTPGVL